MQLEADIANLREISELQEARCIELNAMLGDRDQTLEISQVRTLHCTVLSSFQFHISDPPHPHLSQFQSLLTPSFSLCFTPPLVQPTTLFIPPCNAI